MSSEAKRDRTLSRFRDCAAVLCDEKAFGVERAAFSGADAILGTRGVQLIEGEPHRKLHAFLTRYLADELAPIRATVIRPLIDRALADCAQSETIEIHQGLSAPLSLKTVAAVIGFPHEDREFISAFAAWQSSVTPSGWSPPR